MCRRRRSEGDGDCCAPPRPLTKTFPIKEHYKLEFRFEAYNLTNPLMWVPPPNVAIGNALFGRSTAQATTNRGREMQYTLRFIF